MRKVNVTLIILVVVFVCLNIGQFIWWRHVNSETAQKYTAELANLQAQLDSIGTRVEVYTVAKAVKAGDELTEDNIEVMWTYSTLLTDQYETDQTNILDRYAKIAINPGTAITKNMLMDELLDDTTRDVDIKLNVLPVGLQPGDYIDIRITMPYGDDYIVLSHVRVEELNESTTKVYLTELQWNTYQGAFVDYILNAEYGCRLYATRYVEPGLQQDAVEFYAVPDNIAALLQKNPNIVDKAEASNLNEWRASIEQALVIFRGEDDTVDADGGRLNEGREDWGSSVNDDYQTQREIELEEQAAEAEAEAGGDEITDDFWSEEP